MPPTKHYWSYLGPLVAPFIVLYLFAISRKGDPLFESYTISKHDIMSTDSVQSYDSDDAKSSVTMDKIEKKSAFVTTTEVDEKDLEMGNDNTIAAPEWKATKQVKLVVAAISFVALVVALDATILISALPTIAKDLDANATTTFWIATSYLLTCAVFQPLIASLADVFGRRALLFTAVLLFTVGTIICCLAQSYITLLAGRTVQGIGGGGVYSTNLIILCDLIPLRQRARFQGIYQLVFAVGTIVGPIVGGAFVEHTTWRWIFYLNLPFCAIGLAIVPCLVKYKTVSTSTANKLASIDWVGSALFVASMTSTLVGLSWGGNMFPWSHAATLCPILLGLAGIVGTWYYERFVASAPFLRIWLFHDASAIAAYVCTVIHATLLYACTYYIAFYLTSVKLFSPLTTGIAVLPMGAFLVPVSGLVGALITRLGRYRWALWSGFAITTAACGCLTLLHAHTPAAVWIPVLLACGLGQGLLLISLSVTVQALARPGDAAHASSMYAFMRSLGLCLGVVIGGTVFQDMLQRKVPTAIAKNAEAFVEVLKLMPKGAQREMLVDGYAWSFRMLFATLAGIAAVGMLISLCIPGKEMNVELEGEHHLQTREEALS